MKKLTLILGLSLFCIVKAKANDTLQAVKNYEAALQEIGQMLKSDKEPDFERAIFVIENAYWDNELNYELFRRTIDAHVLNIQKLMEANNHADTINFEPQLDMSKPLHFSGIQHNADEKKEMYRKALANWSIYTYMTKSVAIDKKVYFPFEYNIHDPFGIKNWENSQVVNLLANKWGNCFALTALYKIFSDRLNADAQISTAPGHIYIQHEDYKGDIYNVELASGTHPSDGSIQTLTYTFLDGMQKGVCMRQLNEKQLIALNAVYLGKSAEYILDSNANSFMYRCANIALDHDPNNLNALLLKHQVLSDKILSYSTKANINGIDNLKSDAKISETVSELEKLTVFLYDHGYYQMPLDMQKTILAGLKHEGGQPIFVENKTPKAFESLNVAEKDKRYSTLSGGLFEEVKEKKKLETYGRFVLDTEKKQLVKINYTANEELLIDPVAFAWQIDPLAHEMPGWSPYAAMANNPILNIDPDGKFPWSFHVRSFISTSTSGVAFRGDGRGASFEGTSRVRSSFTVDPAKGSISDLSFRSDPTVFYGLGATFPPQVKTGNPSASITNPQFAPGMVGLDFQHKGKDPITPSFATPALNLQSSLEIKEDIDNGVLTITGSFTGDKFPSSEAYIVDQAGTKAFLGAKREEGGLHSLIGDNNKPLFKVDVQFSFDDDGNFTGVKQGDKTISIDKWNKQVQDEF